MNASLNYPPKVFIIGAQKSGTTTLATLIGLNPDICTSNPKEPNYYTANYANGPQWYRDCFSDHSKILVDASTTYSMSPLTKKSLAYKTGRKFLVDAPNRIHQDSPDAKIIYIVREPVSRLHSNYWHNVKYGYEKKSFDDAMRDDPLYFEMGYYHSQISLYSELFPKKNILILRFEDLISDQLSQFNKCERFIGVPPTQFISTAKKENVGGIYNPVARAIINSSIGRNIDKIVPKRVKSLLKGNVAKKIPKLSKDKAYELSKRFESDQELLMTHYGISYL